MTWNPVLIPEHALLEADRSWRTIPLRSVGQKKMEKHDEANQNDRSSLDELFDSLDLILVSGRGQTF
jgi:hypothetical protein